jgi:RNA polymerase sigma-70 factor (ECF subfamily)
MMDETLHTPETDAEAVAAVRRGDAERYRELVERHERRVFAVAWSRLGDATLAEEATQEAFIRGYRRLWLLGDGAKFSGWITSVVRNVAINLGLRHRRELNKRERWALEHPATSNEPDSAAETDPQHTPETLRRTLAELPAAHRECLVLFYLEGKSGTEAASTLGITEAAFRVRLHRARIALRERLDEQLAASLQKLAPGKSIVPAVMATVLLSTSAKAATGGAIGAGVGTGFWATVGKFIPISALFPLIQVIGSLPGLLFAMWIARLERQNFRDADGFRVRLHRSFYRSFFWGFPLMMLGILLSIHLARAAWGIKGMYMWVLAFMVLVGLTTARSLVINRNPFNVGMFTYCLVLTLGTLAVFLGWIPSTFASLPMVLATVLFITLLNRHRPTRMDYNLFLRATQGLLKLSASAENDSPPKPFYRSDLLSYGRFLGSRWLATHHRWNKRGLVLQLPPVRTSFGHNVISAFRPFPRDCSRLLLGADGTVLADCGDTDFEALAETHPGKSRDLSEIETQVETAILSAWDAFRGGNIKLAERIIGDVPESEVFLAPPARARATRWQRIILGAAVGLMIVAMIALSWRTPLLSQLHPVSITEAQVREAFANYAAHGDHTNSLNNGLAYALSFNFVLPPTNLMTPEALQAIVADISTHIGFPVAATNHSNLERLDRFLLALPLAHGWFGGNGVGLDPKAVTRELKQRDTNEWKFGVLALSLRQCNHGGESFSMVQLDTRSLAQLRWLHDQNSLDFVERDRLINHLVSLQVLSGAAVGKRPPIRNWRDLHGLFYMPGWSPLKDTYCSLAALEILGGLDRIDREACITRILKLHRGKGHFAPPRTEEEWRLQIRGDAQDTFCAFESLRILGALDRVKDLEKWQFRITSRRASVADANGVRTPTWEEIEAWVCQQRLKRILEERKTNPTEPVRSLLNGPL